MRVEMISDVASPSPSLDKIERVTKSVSEEHVLAIPKRRSERARREYMRKTELNQPNFLRRGLDTRSEQM